MSNKFLIVGLGNIGLEYRHTRHNIGFDIAEAFVYKNNGTFTLGRLAEVAELKYKGRQVIVIKPTTYMNLSGRAVLYWMLKEKIPPENILVLVDDIALPINKLRLRPSGSDAGHNGLKSITQMLESDKYPRLRFGIGDNFPKGMQIDYVLGKWTKEEEPVIKNKLEKCIELIESFIFIGIQQTMNQYNKLEFPL